MKALVYRKFEGTATRARCAARRRALLVALPASMGLVGSPAQAVSITDLACGATICLAGDGGSACAPYLDYYNAIDGPTQHITNALRKAFLARCKKVELPDMSAPIAVRQAEIEPLKLRAMADVPLPPAQLQTHNANE